MQNTCKVIYVLGFNYLMYFKAINQPEMLHISERIKLPCHIISNSYSCFSWKSILLSITHMWYDQYFKVNVHAVQHNYGKVEFSKTFKKLPNSFCVYHKSWACCLVAVNGSCHISIT